jgi:hypothetical protein
MVFAEGLNAGTADCVEAHRLDAHHGIWLLSHDRGCHGALESFVETMTCLKQRAKREGSSRGETTDAVKNERK